MGRKFIKQVKAPVTLKVDDSILTIRIKFTAKPGIYFVIRREASCRRISEDRAAKGI